MNLFALFASLSGMIAVILGAFGAHALKGKLTPELLSAYETGVQYQLWHTLALLLLCTFLHFSPNAKLLHFSAYLFMSGIVLFSGSLYILATTTLRHIGMFPIGLITPLG
jgi:uncharacterized membrane protein YgdD (TMEM256/DUF423 family)